ncbi:MAG TPA: isopentenyl transferase family protein, partial [Flavobacteriales bacterium]|nr:isopentenyl transferase family protein [Flavobacteriales bacterium]
MTARGTLVVIGGPTASGKTKAAATIAEHYHTEVISADSRQFYHAMRIGTARPTDEELLGVMHHFVGHLEIERTWSAGQFAREAEPILQELLNTHGIAVVVGGSGLYIEALTKGLDPLPASDPRLRERLQQRAEHGITGLLKELEKHDPVIFARI